MYSGQSVCFRTLIKEKKIQRERKEIEESFIVYTLDRRQLEYLDIEMNRHHMLHVDMLHNNHLNIFDLPNEILMIILNKLNMIDALYSLVDVNQRFNQLIFSYFYIHKLDMTFKSSFNYISSTNNQILDTICKKVLPRIHHQVYELIIEQHSIRHILHTLTYPKLYSLSLIKFEDEVLLNHLSGNYFTLSVIISTVLNLFDMKN